MNYLAAIAPFLAAIAIIFAYGLSAWVKKADSAPDSMKEAAGNIRASAMTFLKREYKAMFIAVVAVFAIVGFLIDWLTAAFYVSGAALSALAVFLGTRAATSGGVRTANAAVDNEMMKAFKLAFRSGAVMGLCVAGIGLIGIGLIVFAFGPVASATFITGFGMGALSSAMFARAYGGVFARTAGAGGDVVSLAGMGSDAFGYFVCAMISAIVLSAAFPEITPWFGESFEMDPTAGALFPLLLSAVGVAASLAGIMLIRGGDNINFAATLRTGNYVSGVIVIIGAIILSKALFDNYDCAASVVAGRIIGFAIGKVNEVYSSENRRHVRMVAQQCQTGYAPTVIGGLTVGMRSAFWPLIFIAAGVLSADMFAGSYGIALAAVGMLSTVGMTAATGAYGPVFRNAGEIVEISGLAKEARAVTGRLGMAENTSGTIGKGVTAGAAAVTSIAFVYLYSEIIGLETINILAPIVLAGLLLGAMLPFFFSALAVDTAIISARGIAAPGLLAVIAPVFAGIVMGAEALGGMLAGALASGTLLATLIGNAGGVWDGTKKTIENGNYGGKKSKAYRAAVLGGSVGDPFKDISVPSINVFIMTMAMIAVMFADKFMRFGGLI